MSDHFRALSGLACSPSSRGLRFPHCRRVAAVAARRRCGGASACRQSRRRGVGLGRPGGGQAVPGRAPRRRRRRRRSGGRQQPDHEVERPRRLLVVRGGSQGVDDRDAGDGAGRGRFGDVDAHDGHDRSGQARGRLVGRPAGRELREPRGCSTTRRSTRASRSRPRWRPESTRKARFKIADINTHKDAGICKACWNHFGKDLTLTTEWKEYRVTFSGAEQEPGWGDPRPDVDHAEQADRAQLAGRPGPDLRHLDRRRHVPRLRVTAVRGHLNV